MSQCPWQEFQCVKVYLTGVGLRGWKISLGKEDLLIWGPASMILSTMAYKDTLARPNTELCLHPSHSRFIGFL